MVKVSAHILDIEDYNEIYSSLRELSADWEDIGIHLGIKKYTLDKIRADFSKCDKRLSELLAVWLRRNTLNHPLPSWKNLCIALSKIDRSRAEKIGSEHPCACIECLTGLKSGCGLSQIFSNTATISLTSTLIGILILYLVRGNLIADPPRGPSEVRRTTFSNNVVTPDIEKRIWIAGETGSDVVKKCVEKLQETGIFPDDKDFMERLAYVMSRYGEATFRLYTDGGIWQVSQFAFQDTKDEIAHIRLPGKYKSLLETLGVDWRAARRRDLEIPMYSAIAARLYLSNFPEAIPPSSQIQKQQIYWWRFYMMNHESKRFMDKEDYTHGVNKLMSQS